MFDMNSGYSGYSMSKRAIKAYAYGEMPLSQWTKEEILAQVDEIDETKAEKLRKVRLPVLKDELLNISSWHHTSSFCNETTFYTLNVDLIENLTDEKIEEWKTRKKKDSLDAEHFRGDITYLEWSGSRNHRRAKSITLTDMNIEKRGCFYYIRDDGNELILRKKIGSRGTSVTRY